VPCYWGKIGQDSLEVVDWVGVEVVLEEDYSLVEVVMKVVAMMEVVDWVGVEVVMEVVAMMEVVDWVGVEVVLEVVDWVQT